MSARAAEQESATMTVKDIMTTRRIISVAPEDDLMFAARVMSWAGMPYLPVCVAGKVVGVLTEHDYVRYRAERGAGAGNTPVSKAMSTPAVTVHPDDPADVASRIMLSRGTGYAVIVDREGGLVGVLTAGDLLAADVRSAAPRADASVSISEVMTRDPVTARPYEPVLEAVALMTERGFKHVPIVDDDRRLVGIVSDRDVRTAIGDPAEALHRELAELEELPLSTIMTTPAESVSEDAPLVEVAHRLAHESIGALPVVDSGSRVVGIVSYVDVVRKLLDLVTTRRGVGSGPH